MRSWPLYIIVIEHKKRDFFVQTIHKSGHMLEVIIRLLPAIDNTSIGSDGTITYSITPYVIL